MDFVLRILTEASALVFVFVSKSWEFKAAGLLIILSGCDCQYEAYALLRSASTCMSHGAAVGRSFCFEKRELAMNMSSEIQHLQELHSKKRKAEQNPGRHQA